MLSTYDNPTYVARAVALGACDYVLKALAQRIGLGNQCRGDRSAPLPRR